MEFRQLQASYTPAALPALAKKHARGRKSSEQQDNEVPLVENVPLMLPSAMTDAERKVGCQSKVIDIEL